MSYLDYVGHDHGDSTMTDKEIQMEVFNCDYCRKRHGYTAAPEGYHDNYCEVCRQKHKRCNCALL